MSIPHLAFCPQCKKPNWILNFTRFTNALCQNCQTNLDVLSDPLLFQTIFDHQILSLIGRGGMGRVYLAQNIKWKNYVAAKAQIHQETSLEQKERFWNEARILKDFEHPNIVKFIGAIENELGSFLFMEYFPGIKLSHLIVQQFPVPIKQILFLFREVCLALQHVHERGCIHQDLKPNNVLVGEKGDIRLIDFGISVSKTSATTRPEKTMGTFSYMAPEQLAGKLVDERSDIYSLGSLFFFMLTGQKPFDPTIFPEIKKQTFNHNLVALIRQTEAYPSSVLDLLARMTEPLPEKRFAQIQEILDSLEICSPEKSPQQSKLWLNQKLKDQNMLVSSVMSSGTWQAIPPKIALIPVARARSSFFNKRFFLLMSLLFIAVATGAFFNSQLFLHSISENIENTTLIVPETEKQDPSEMFVSKGFQLVTEKLLKSLDVPNDSALWEQFFQEMVLFDTKSSDWSETSVRLQARFLLEWKSFFSRPLSKEVLEGFQFFLEVLPSPKLFLAEILEVLFEPSYPENTRRFLFQCLLKYQQLSLLLPYYQHPQLKTILNWNPEKRFLWISNLFYQNPSDVRLFEFLQILSGQEQLLLEIEGSYRESDLQKKIIAKYKNKNTLEESILIPLFQNPEHFKRVFYFLTQLQTEAAHQLLFRLLLKSPRVSDAGELLWNYFNQFKGQIPLEITPILKYLKAHTQSAEERKQWTVLIRKLSGIDLTFVHEIDAEYLRLRESKGTKGFELGWKQDLLGFELASLCENSVFQIFYFEKLKKNHFVDISFEEQITASRTSPLFFQELLISWLLLQYPELKQHLPKAKEFTEETPLNQFREGVEHLTQSVFALVTALPPEKISPKRLQCAFQRFRVKQLVATTDLQKTVSVYYGLLDALLLLGSEAEENKYRAVLMKWDPLCKTAEDQILLALKVLQMRIHSWLADPLFQMKED